MADAGAIVVVGGTTGIGRALAKDYADRGYTVVVTGRDQERAEKAAAEIGGDTTGIGVDLGRLDEIGPAFAGVGPVAHLAIVAVLRDDNFVRTFDPSTAQDLVTMKLVGYPEVVHALSDRMSDTSSILLFGGLAKERPYPGGTTIAIANGGVTSMIRPMALELAPIRVNAIHPAIVGDSWFWEDKPPEVLEGFRSRTPTGRLITTAEVVDACRFLLENGGMNGQNLHIDGGWLLT